MLTETAAESQNEIGFPGVFYCLIGVVSCSRITSMAETHGMVFRNNPFCHKGGHDRYKKVFSDMNKFPCCVSIKSTSAYIDQRTLRVKQQINRLINILGIRCKSPPAG